MATADPAFRIDELRDHPEFFDAVADRIWNAWWQLHRAPRDYIATRLEDSLASPGIPFALVAHRDGAFAECHRSSSPIGTSGRNICPGSRQSGLSPTAAARVWAGRLFSGRAGRRSTQVTTASISASARNAVRFTRCWDGLRSSARSASSGLPYSFATTFKATTLLLTSGRSSDDHAAMSTVPPLVRLWWPTF